MKPSFFSAIGADRFLCYRALTSILKNMSARISLISKGLKMAPENPIISALPKWTQTASKMKLVGADLKKSKIEKIFLDPFFRFFERRKI